jgi:hypothetical protein
MSRSYSLHSTQHNAQPVPGAKCTQRFVSRQLPLARPLNTPLRSRSQPTGHVAHPMRSIHIFPNNPKTTKPHSRKSITMKRIPTSKPVGLPRFTYALSVCALIVGTLGVGSGLAADKNAKGHARLRARSAKCAGQKHQGCTGRIWSRRFVAGPHASKVSLHLCDRSRGSHSKFGQ